MYCFSRWVASTNLYCGTTPDQTTLFDHSFWNVSSWALPNAGFESCSSAVHSLWKAGNLQYLQRKRNKCWNSWWVCGFNLFQMHVNLEIFPYHHFKRAIPTFILLILKREIHHTRIQLQPDRFFGRSCGDMLSSWHPPGDCQSPDSHFSRGCLKSSVPVGSEVNVHRFHPRCSLRTFLFQ